MNYQKFISKWLRGKGFSAKCLKFAYFSLFLGSFALMMALSVLEGFHQEIINLAFKYDSNIKINTFNRSLFEFDKKYKDLISETFIDFSAHPVIESEVLANFNGNNDIFRFKASDAKILEEKFELNGTLGDKNIAISKIIATRNKLNIGDEIVLFHKDLENESSRVKIKKFKIGAIFNTGLSEIDENLILMDIKDARNLLRLNSNLAQSIEIYLNDQKADPKTIQILETKFGYPFYVRRAEDIHFAKIAWIEVQKQPIPIVLALISLVAVSNVVTTMLVLILEKIKSIGIFRALGLSKKQLILALMYKSIRIGLYGSISGALFAILVGLLVSNSDIIKLPTEIYFVDSIPFVFMPIHLIIIILSSVLFSLFAAIIPGYIATKFSPVRSIRGFR